MIRVVLLIDPVVAAEGDPLIEVQSWDWYDLVNGPMMVERASVEVESVEWVNR